MGLFDALKSFTSVVNHEYERRIKAASLIKEYDPTGASHHHEHVEVQGEQVVAVEDHGATNGHEPAMRPTSAAEQSAPREVTH